MLIQLPIEVWMEILDFLRGHRRKLAVKFNQFGDHTFSEFYQHWLHKYTKNVQLGLLTIDQEIVFNKEGNEESNGLLKICFPLLLQQLPTKRVINDRNHRRIKVPFADVPMPENITGCEELQISYLDSGVLNFLRLMMPAFVSNSGNTALYIVLTDKFDDPVLNEEDFTRMRTALRHLLPLFTNRSITYFSFHSRTSSIFSFILHQFPEQLFSAKLICFSDVTHTIVPSIVRWLCTKRTDGETRIAIIYWINQGSLLYEAIREAATSSVSFGMWHPRFPESSHKNEATGEQLIVRQHPNNRYCLIGRFSSADVVDVDQWFRKMGARTNQIQSENQFGSRIRLFKPSLGQLESTAGEDEGSSAAMIPSNKRRQGRGDDEEEKVIDQPGPSKKQRN